jgi:hypothetical protein
MIEVRYFRCNMVYSVESVFSACWSFADRFKHPRFFALSLQHCVYNTLEVTSVMDGYSAANCLADMDQIAQPEVQRVARFFHHSQSEVIANQVTMLSYLASIHRSTSERHQVIAHPVMTNLPSTLSFPDISGHCPVLPSVIHADCGIVPVQSDFSIGSGDSGTSSSYGTSTSASGDDARGPSLHCPFCQQKHYSEKTHVQHLHRMIIRFIFSSHDALTCGLCHTVVTEHRYIIVGSAPLMKVTGC